jgi:hypothetical protein
VEYEDCYLQIRGIQPALAEWLNDSVQGQDPFRDFSIYHVDRGEVIAKTVVQSAFLRDFRLSDFDAPVFDLPLSTFIVVPETLQTHADTSNLLPGPPPRTKDIAFEVRGVGVRAGDFVALSGIHVSFPKFPREDERELRRVFQPGPAAFDDFVLEVRTLGAEDTIEVLEAWVRDVEFGSVQPRDLSVDLLQTVDGETDPIGVVELHGVAPVSFSPFPIGDLRVRALVLDLDHFLFEGVGQP